MSERALTQNQVLQTSKAFFKTLGEEKEHWGRHRGSSFIYHTEVQ